MRKRIFYSTFAVSLLTLLVSIIVFFAFNYSNYKNNTEEQLKHEAIFISQGVEKLGLGYFDDFKTPYNRVTWIGNDGSVLYDSLIKDYDRLENHLERQEVKGALEKGYGISNRYSSTLERSMMYYALKTETGSVVRVCSDIPTIQRMLVDFLPTFILVIIGAFVFSFFLSRKVAKRIVKPINDIDLENPCVADEYAEASLLIERIREQNRCINEQMEKLGRQRREFSFITQNMSEGFVIASANKELLSFNSAALKLLGCDDCIKENDSILMLSSSEQFVFAVNEAIQGRKSEITVQNGSKMCRIIASPVIINRDVSGIIMVIIDVSESRQREKLRREFSSNVSHELKTPLTSIYGISDMIVSGIVKSEDINAFALSIKNEAGRLICLIEDIIRLSKLDESGDSGVEFEKQHIDLYEVAEDVILRLCENPQRGITIKLEGESAVINGVYSVVDEMIFNLCENAVKYNKDGGSIWVTVASSDGRGIITVKDTGIGISANDIDRIFERFYRVDKSHSKKIGGTGLGLSIVKHAVAFHGGSIKVESAVGEGSTFTVELPLAAN